MIDLASAYELRDVLDNKVIDSIIDADLIIFNIKILNPNRQGSIITENKKINFFNYMKYGSCRIAFRKSRVDKYNIRFDELFGAGATYTSGEDTIFMNDCLKHGLKIYTCPDTIAYVKQIHQVGLMDIMKNISLTKALYLQE